MKLLIKNLKGESFSVDVEPNDTIFETKRKIFALRPDAPAERQKLIHSGKVLNNDSTITENNVKEGEFLVFMVSKEAR